MAPYSGSFNDGRSAARQEVSVRLDLSGLRILGPDGREVARWPYEALRLLDEDLGTRSLRLKCGEEGAARLTLADRRLLADLAAYAPQLARTRRGHPGLLRALGLGALGLFVFLALVWVVVPRMAEWTAGLIPVSWEEALGERAMEQTLEVLSALGEGRPRSCAGPAGQAALERLSARVAAAMDTTADAPYRFQVSVLDFKMANAFALPGGRIVFFGELIGQAESPDEVAGVLAHEMGHVSRRHGTQALLRSLGLEVLFGLLLGDLGEGLFGSLGAAMLSLSYTREAEAEADALALDVLEGAGIRADGLAAFFERLAETDRELPAALKLLSTHPSHEARARLFADAAGQGGPAMSAADWAALQGICKE
jgi:Zn-dependent protease with chaperone function